MSWIDATPPECREMDSAALAEIARTGRCEPFEKEFVRKDGSRVPVLIGAAGLDEGGGVGFAIDLTERKRAETERNDLLTRLEAQIERLPLAYLLSGPDLRYTRWNPAAERMFGFAEADVLGKHPFEVIVPAAARPAVGDIFERLRAGDMNAHGACENATEDGRVITCEWHNTPLFDDDGKFAGIISLAQDISARCEGEKTLLLRDRAIQAVVQGILITDCGRQDDPIIYASPGVAALTGYPNDEVVGRNCRFLQGRDTDPAAVARIRDAVRGGTSCTVELLNYRKDGSTFWNELSLAPVADATGRPTHFVGVQTDVTRRRQLEEQFRQSQKMEAFGQLAGGVAHDFNNLLTVISGYSELVLAALGPDDRNRAPVEEIHKAGERATLLTRQLLAFSRKQVVQPKVLDLNEVVAGAEKMLGRLIGEDVTLTAVLAAGLDPVKVDPGQIEQVVMNLVVNARDAMPQGGKIVVETANVDLAGGSDRSDAEVKPGRYVLLAVSDTGTGMTEEVMRHLFEPFFTTKEVGKGTGLGLAVVHGVVRQAGGHIAVASAPGVGTTFKIYLPRVGRPEPSGPAPAGRAALPRGTETVLLVEDDDGVRFLTGHLLKGLGYAVLEAAGGAEGLRVAAGHAGPVRLLITDVVMPGMSGLQAAEGLAAIHPEAKVLFVSGYTDDVFVRHGLRQDEAPFLPKPFSPVALACKIRELLDPPGPAGA